MACVDWSVKGERFAYCNRGYSLFARIHLTQNGAVR